MSKVYETYQRLSGESGVKAYRFGDDYIEVVFNDGGTYLYTYRSAGKKNVEQMKILARKGEGLSGFISKNVHDLWERKTKIN